MVLQQPVALKKFLDLLDALKGQAGRIDVLLAMGATPLESTSLDLAAALARGLVPHLNSMNVIGLVAIPGMMTGQIIAGGSPGRAVRYQMMIMYMVAASTGISSGMSGSVDSDAMSDTGTATAPAVSSRGYRLGLARRTGGGGGGSGGGGR